MHTMRESARNFEPPVHHSTPAKTPSLMVPLQIWISGYFIDTLVESGLTIWSRDAHLPLKREAEKLESKSFPTCANFRICKMNFRTVVAHGSSRSSGSMASRMSRVLTIFELQHLSGAKIKATSGTSTCGRVLVEQETAQNQQTRPAGRQMDWMIHDFFKDQRHPPIIHGPPRDSGS